MFRRRVSAAESPISQNACPALGNDTSRRRARAKPTAIASPGGLKCTQAGTFSLFSLRFLVDLDFVFCPCLRCCFIFFMCHSILFPIAPIAFQGDPFGWAEHVAWRCGTCILADSGGLFIASSESPPKFQRNPCNRLLAMNRTLELARMHVSHAETTLPGNVLGSAEGGALLRNAGKMNSERNHTDIKMTNK